jgi:hypothetical protein
MKRENAAADLTTRLEAIRTEIAAVDELTAETANARVTRAEAIARIDAALAQATGTAGRWSWSHKANVFAFAHAPRLTRGLLVPDPVAGTVSEIGGWLVATFGDAIRARLIAGLPEDAPGVSAADRTRKLAELATRRLDLERREERLILEAEVAGVTLDRRGDLSPAVYLETTL